MLSLLFVHMLLTVDVSVLPPFQAPSMSNTENTTVKDVNAPWDVRDKSIFWSIVVYLYHFRTTTGTLVTTGPLKQWSKERGLWKNTQPWQLWVSYSLLIPVSLEEQNQELHCTITDMFWATHTGYAIHLHLLLWESIMIERVVHICCKINKWNICSHISCRKYLLWQMW